MPITHSSARHSELPDTYVMMSEVAAKSLIRNYGIRTPVGRQLSPNGEGLSALSDMRPPWVLKIISDEIIHKSDGGFVALGLTNHAELIAEVDRMREGAKQIGADVSGFLVEEMASKGTELVVGGFLDPSFGPLIMVGMGGVFVEIFKDVSFRICPISRIDAEDMIDGLKCKPILEGARGIQPVERAALVDLLLKVGGKDGILLREVEKIMELDLNPVIARGSDLVAVDARIRLKGSV